MVGKVGVDVDNRQYSDSDSDWDWTGRRIFNKLNMGLYWDCSPARSNPPARSSSWPNAIQRYGRLKSGRGVIPCVLSGGSKV